jgi:hypothetical protein
MRRVRLQQNQNLDVPVEIAQEGEPSLCKIAPTPKSTEKIVKKSNDSNLYEHSIRGTKIAKEMNVLFYTASFAY